MEMTRGDSGYFYFQRLDDNGDPITVKADHCWFTVKTNDMQKEPVIQKTIEDMTFDDDGTYHITILPEDTNELQYGEYIYDIEVLNEDGYKKTISKGIFELTWESTFANNEV